MDNEESFAAFSAYPISNNPIRFPANGITQNKRWGH